MSSGRSHKLTRSSIPASAGFATCLDPTRNRPVAEIRDCNLHVFRSECSPDGKYYVIEGLAGTRGNVTRVANLYEGSTGKKLGPLPDQKPVRFDGASFSFDPTGGVLNYFYEPTAEGSRAYFLEMPSLAVLRQFDQAPYCLGPRAKRWLLASPVTADQPALCPFSIKNSRTL